MRTDLTIEIVVLIEKSTGKNRVVYLSDYARAEGALDLFVSESTRRIALCHQDAYDNDTLKARRNQNNMHYPGSDIERMIYVGQLLSSLKCDSTTHIEVSRAQLHLKQIPVDEL
jgi:hypothetical protein